MSFTYYLPVIYICPFIYSFLHTLPSFYSISVFFLLPYFSFICSCRCSRPSLSQTLNPFTQIHPYPRPRPSGFIYWATPQPLFLLNHKSNWRESPRPVPSLSRVDSGWQEVCSVHCPCPIGLSYTVLSCLSRGDSTFHGKATQLWDGVKRSYRVGEGRKERTEESRRKEKKRG